MSKRIVERNESEIREGRDVVAESRTEWTRFDGNDGDWLKRESSESNDPETDSVDQREIVDSTESQEATTVRNSAALEGQFVHHFVQDVAERNRDVEYIDSERTVMVEKSDSESDGRIDLVLGDEDGDKAVIDVKNHDMSQWTETTARRWGDAHGRQVQGYIDSEGVDEGAQGYIMATNPPGLSEIRNAYQEGAERHDVSVKFIDNFSEDTVTDALQEISEENEIE